MSPHIAIAFVLAASMAGGEEDGLATATTSIDAPESRARASETPPDDDARKTEADDDARKTEAVVAYKAGKEAFAAAEYYEALGNFKRAQELLPTPELHYNIGLCHERVDNWDRAIESFEHYLEETPEAFDRADVESRIDAAKRRKSKEARVDEPAEPVTELSKKPRVRAEPPLRIVSSEPSTRDKEPRPHRALIAGGGTLFALGAAGAIGGGVGLTLHQRAEGEEKNQRLNALRWSSIGGGSVVAAAGAAMMGVGLKRRSDARARRVQVVPRVGLQGASVTVVGRF